ncbi:hypothetical protein NHX12_002697 [Muraenolepis orangiensis]|uniref:Uncharacterized protein n=1 Tax=Muraenolepis orangiensis TaxID=630683 RepID=A0A9Q0DXP9_9TELE|nr:hypothetical protein NHX12_002697 [Muraenolepis orangiensis]
MPLENVFGLRKKGGLGTQRYLEVQLIATHTPAGQEESASVKPEGTRLADYRGLSEIWLSLPGSRTLANMAVPPVVP